LLYLGALLSLVMALTDLSLRPLTYAFTIALVTSWALRMAYGIWLELRRVRQEEQEKTRKLNEILQRHGLSEDQSAALAKEIKNLG
jgi:ribosomal protein L4